MKVDEPNKIYFKIREIIHSTYYYWYLYEQLSRDSETIRVINRGSHIGFFLNLRQLLIHQVVQCVSNLLDQTKDSKGNENITLERIIKECIIDENTKIDLLTKLSSLKTKDEIKRIRKYRHKIISHFDFKAYIEKESSDLLKKDYTITISIIRNALKSIKDLLNDIGKEASIKSKYDEHSAKIDAENHLHSLIHALQKEMILDELKNTGRIDSGRKGEYGKLYNRRPNAFIYKIKVLNPGISSV